MDWRWHAAKPTARALASGGTVRRAQSGSRGSRAAGAGLAVVGGAADRANGRPVCQSHRYRRDAGRLAAIRAAETIGRSVRPAKRGRPKRTDADRKRSVGFR